MVARSASGQSAGQEASASCSTGTDSPVSEASWTLRLAASTMRTSAGTMSPSASSTTSPATRSRASTTRSSPPRTTRACGALMLRSASSDDCALLSCTMPMRAFATTMSRMTAPSASSPSAAESAAATMSMSIMGSRIWPTTICPSVRGGLARSSLGPSSARRRAASASERPRSGSHPRRSKTWAVGRACHAVPRSGSVRWAASLQSASSIRSVLLAWRCAVVAGCGTRYRYGTQMAASGCRPRGWASCESVAFACARFVQDALPVGEPERRPPPRQPQVR